MKNSPFKIVAGSLFLAVVAFFCLFSFWDFLSGNGHQPDIQQLAIATLGILGIALYLCKVNIYSYLLYAWILMQVMIISKISGDTVNSLIDFHLLFDYGFSFTATISGAIYSIGINLVPLVFIPFMFTLKQEQKLIGEEFMLKQYRENDFLLDRLPQVVKVLDILNFSGRNTWVLVHLSKGISHENTNYFHALIKAKDYISIKKRSKKQIAHFRLFDGHKNPEKGLKEFPFIDWVIVE